MVKLLLDEWFSSTTLSAVLEKWESSSGNNFDSKQAPLNILSYNVQGWGTRCLEVIDIVYQVDASVCIFSEVGELWNSFALPNFNMFHEKGTNHSGGVCVAVGKHLRTTQIETKTENTVVVDIIGLSEPLRVIGIYWPQCQKRNLDDLLPFIQKNTIISGDFNAAVEEWG